LIIQILAFHTFLIKLAIVEYGKTKRRRPLIPAYSSAGKLSKKLENIRTEHSRIP